MPFEKAKNLGIQLAMLYITTWNNPKRPIESKKPNLTPQPGNLRGSCHFSWGTPPLLSPPQHVSLLLNLIVFLSQLPHDLWSSRLLWLNTTDISALLYPVTTLKLDLFCKYEAEPPKKIFSFWLLQSQQSCSQKNSDKQALIHQGWWDFVHILSTGHELEYLPNLVWKSAGLFPSFLAPGPICSLNCLSDQPSILYRHRIYHLWSLLLSLKEKRILLWYSMSSDKCLQNKSTGYTAEVLMP